MSSSPDHPRRGRMLRCMLAGCATSPEEDPVQIRMNDLDARLQRIERVVTNQSLLEMAQRIDALQAELRTMRGEVELLQNQSEGGKTQNRSLYGDLEKRIAALETLGGVGRRWRRGRLPPSARGSARAPAAVASRPAMTPRSTRSRAATIRAPSRVPRLRRDVSQERAGQQRAVLAGRGVLRHARVPERHRRVPESHHRLAGFAQGSRRAGQDRLHAVGAGSQRRRARSRSKTWSERYPGTEAAQLATERLKRLPANAK